MNSQNCSLNTSEAQSTAQYIHSFLDLVENLPNEISRHLSQLHQLNNNYLKLINRTDTNVDRYKQVVSALANNRPNCSNNNIDGKDIDRSDDSTENLIEKRRNLSKKIETQLIQIQELSDEKLRYSQIIFDLIETKAKELDLDYEEVIQFNGKINGSETIVNRMNGMNTSSASNKLNANNSSQNCPNVGTTSQIKEDNKQKEVNEDINNKIIDKRSLPRRACAVKSGHSVENNEELIETNVVKVPQNKTIKSKSFSKSHNFGLSMSNFYRNMARRRAKLPKGSKIHKIGAKISDSKKSVQSLKTDRKSKSNKNSIKRLIAAKSAVKQTNGSTNHVHNKKLVRNKSNSYSSSSSSSSSESSMSDNEELEAPNGSVSRNNSQKKEKEKKTTQENGRRESKRSSNNHNNNNSSNNKKTKTNSNSVESTEQFVGEPIDPNEPTYCLCDQVSFGQMICCDNDRCTIEWFHFPCVGLEVKPKGKWYCPRCRKAPRLQNVPKKHTNSAKD